MAKLLNSAAVLLGSAVALTAAEPGIFVEQYQVDTIYYAAQERSARAAAQDLQKYLFQITGQKLHLKSRANNAKRGIFVGRKLLPPQLIQQLNLPDSNLEYVVRAATPGALYLFGNEIGKSYGNRWAVTRFLDRELGVKWLWPGELGEKVPQQARIDIASGIRVEQPSFRVRCYPWLYFGLGGYYTQEEMREMREWALIRHQFGSTLEGYNGMGFGHAYFQLVPQKEFGTTHPEYYSLVSPANWSGAAKPDQMSRTNHNPDYFQLCTSNPKLRQLVANRIAALKTDKIVSISPNDGYMFCECENCRKLDKTRWQSLYSMPDLSNRIFDFAADVCRRVKKLNPQGKLGMFAYSFFSGAPDCLQELPDNLFLSMTYRCAAFRDPVTKKQFEARIKKFGQLKAQFIGREYWSDHTIWSMPWLHTKYIAENLKFIKAHGAVGIYGEAGRDWANNALNYYVLARLMWDCSLQLEDIIAEFCDHAFGSASEAMQNYFKFMENHIDNYYANRVRQHLPMNHNSYAGYMTMFEELYTPEFIVKAQKLLNTAVRSARNAADKKRVEFFRIGLNYAKIFTARLRIYRRAVACGAHLVFLKPEPGIDCIDDDLIRQTFAEAERISRNQLYYVLRYQGKHAIDSGIYLYIGKTTSMPWDRTIQEQKLIHQQGFYNYLVNGAFEYDFGWNFVPEQGQVTAEIDVSKCHDNAYNFMAMCHGGQGRSLKLTMKPDSRIALRSTVKIQTPPNRCWQLQGFINRLPQIQLKANLEYDANGKKSKIALIPTQDEVITDSRNWQKVRFRPVKLPIKAPTAMRLVLHVSNPSAQTCTVNLDDFSLKIFQ